MLTPCEDYFRLISADVVQDDVVLRARSLARVICLTVENLANLYYAEDNLAQIDGVTVKSGHSKGA